MLQVSILLQYKPFFQLNNVDESNWVKAKTISVDGTVVSFGDE